MAQWVQTLVTVVCAVLASSGFWAWLQARRDKKDAKTRMLLGLGHDRLVYLCMKYIERGWVSSDEYEDLNKYLYMPYTEMGGNGTVKKLMMEVQKLPIHHISYMQQAKQNDQSAESD
jgi:hypothetical protein